ncbi:MAG: hypothetical protein WA790_11215 [Sulfitobacter sp.]
MSLSYLTSDLDRIVSSLNRPPSFDEGISNPDNTKQSSQKRKAGDNHHQESPFGHILLSIKVLSGLGLALCGLGGFYHTLAQGGRLSVNASGQRAILCGLIMLAGGYLIAANVHAHGSPRCENNNGNPTDYQTDSECF